MLTNPDDSQCSIWKLVNHLNSTPLTPLASFWAAKAGGSPNQKQNQSKAFLKSMNNLKVFNLLFILVTMFIVQGMLRTVDFPFVKSNWFVLKEDFLFKKDKILSFIAFSMIIEQIDNKLIGLTLSALK